MGLLGDGKPKSYETPRSPLFKMQGEWPKCSSDYLFIWEAIDIAGRSLLPDEWTGEELNVLDWPESPKDGVERARANNARMLAGMRTVSGSGRIQRSEPLAEQHNSHVIRRVLDLTQRAIDREQAEWEENQAVLARVKRVANWLDGCFRDGAVLTSSRFVDLAAELLPMQGSDWFAENNFARRMVPGKFKRMFVATQKAFDVYIFVNRATLDHQLAKLNGPTAAEAIAVNGIDLDQLSPYLRMAIAMTIRLELSENNPPDVEQLGQILFEAGESFGFRCGSKPGDELSPSLAKDMAKLMRWPSARAGRGKGATH